MRSSIPPTVISSSQQCIKPTSKPSNHPFLKSSTQSLVQPLFHPSIHPSIYPLSHLSSHTSSFRLSIQLPIRLFIYQSNQPAFYPSNYFQILRASQAFIHPSIHRSSTQPSWPCHSCIHQSIQPSVYSAIHQSNQPINQSLQQYIHVPIRRSNYIFIFPSSHPSFHQVIDTAIALSNLQFFHLSIH